MGQGNVSFLSLIQSALQENEDAARALHRYR